MQIKITKEDIQANIKQIEFVIHKSHGGQLLRWCVITTINGFAVTGKPSCCVCPEEDIPSEGERIAYNNAEDELWTLLGYELKTKIYQQNNTTEGK